MTAEDIQKRAATTEACGRAFLAIPLFLTSELWHTHSTFTDRRDRRQAS